MLSIIQQWMKKLSSLPPPIPSIFPSLLASSFLLLSTSPSSPLYRLLVLIRTWSSPNPHFLTLHFILSKRVPLYPVQPSPLLLAFDWHISFPSHPSPSSVSSLLCLSCTLTSSSFQTSLSCSISFPFPLSPFVPPLNVLFSSRSSALSPWHQFVGCYDNLPSQVIYSRGPACLPHSTGCVWTRFNSFICINYIFLYALCLLVNVPFRETIWFKSQQSNMHKTAYILCIALSKYNFLVEILLHLRGIYQPSTAIFLSAACSTYLCLFIESMKNIFMRCIRTIVDCLSIHFVCNGPIWPSCLCASLSTSCPSCVSQSGSR